MEGFLFSDNQDEMGKEEDIEDLYISMEMGSMILFLRFFFS